MLLQISFSGNASPQETHEWFASGFGIARMTLFKLVREGRRSHWDEFGSPETRSSTMDAV